MRQTPKPNNSGTPGEASTQATSAHPTQAELSYIAGVTARDHSIKVSIGAPGAGSYANLETKSITLDPEHTKNESHARFVSAHEGAHIGETPSLEQLGRKTPEQRREYKGQIGLHPLVNVIEDGAINDRFCRKFPNLQSDTLSAYPRSKSGDPIGIIDLPEVQAIAASIGRPPLYARALAGILTDWAELRHDLRFASLIKESEELLRIW